MDTKFQEKVIVTGGAGFIGSHLTDALIEEGFEVHVIDNLSRGKKENINSRAVFHKLDIRDFDSIVPVFKNTVYVFHVAALPRVMPSIADPRTTHDVNVTGTLNVSLAARDAQVKRVIYSSSSSVYGNQKTLPLHEELLPSPMHPYGLQKYMGEQLARVFFDLYKLETVSLRYFNVYGERAPLEGDYAQAIGRFLKQKQEKKPLTIVPDGKQSRDFTHVRDVVRANILAALSKNIKAHEAINIGGGKNYTVLELADMIGGERIFIEPRTEGRHTRADIRKARALLGWNPEVILPDGIAELKKKLKLS
ncbi:MAG: NAD-dependent epimerase/dehydratase family protein [Parcubacteria group bacterium]|nr:NAD-dependent epimerase/dehydratase family protein [Parcubacteria group bacterium]